MSGSLYMSNDMSWNVRGSEQTLLSCGLNQKTIAIIKFEEQRMSKRSGLLKINEVNYE